jgi:cell division septation protein DedD
MFRGAPAALVTRAAFRSRIGGDAVTRNALVVATTLAGLLALATLAGCSREKIDWKSAESADTVEGYDHFLERHPEGELATQARARVAQLNEDRDWKRATAADTADAYRQFLAQHDSGKWAEEARIRVENFSLDGTAAGPASPSMSPGAAATSPTPATASPPATAATPAAGAVTPAPTHGPKEAQSPPANSAAAAKPAAVDNAVASAKPSSGKPAAPDKHIAAAKPATPSKPASAAIPAAPAGIPAATATPVPFGIQLGAFRSQDAALNSWKQLQVKFDSDLHGLFARAVPVQQSAGQLFRLQAPVGEEARARAICASLTKRSQPCVVVLPPSQ